MVQHKLTTELISSTAQSFIIDIKDLPKDIEGLSNDDLENKWIVVTQMIEGDVKRFFVFDDQLGVIYFVRGVINAQIQGAAHKVYGVYHKGIPTEITIGDVNKVDTVNK